MEAPARFTVSSALAAASPPSDVLHVAHNVYSVSPDPRKPCETASVASLPNRSPTRTLFACASNAGGGGVADDEASVVLQGDGVVLPSIASSIHSGGLGAVADASFSQQWYPAWAVPRHDKAVDTALTPPCVAPVAPPPSVLPASQHGDHLQQKQQQQQPTLSLFQSPEGKTYGNAFDAGLAIFAHTSALDYTRLARDAAGDASSVCPDTLGHTMPPNRSKTLSGTVSGLAVTRAIAAPQVRIHVEGCTGLPNAPFLTSAIDDAEEEQKKKKKRGNTGKNDVYVYVRSNRREEHYKSAAVPYDTTVLFLQTSQDFVLPMRPAQASSEGDCDRDDEEVLTFTVAVRLSANGKHVKLGVGQLAMCNLPEGRVTRVAMPIVAKAGRARARERGMLLLQIEAEACGLSHESRPPLEESAVRERILTVVRRVCREKLHQVEVLVRRHCGDTAVALQRFLSELEADHLLSQATAARAKEHGHVAICPDNGGPSDTRRHGSARSASSSSSLSSARADGDSSLSPFTSYVLEEQHALHRSFSYAAAPRTERAKVADTREAAVNRPNAEVERKAETSGKPNTAVSRAKQAAKKVHGGDARYGRSHSAPFSSKACRAAYASDLTHASSAPLKRQVRIDSLSLRGLRGEDGLPLFECSCCHIQLSLLGGDVSFTTPTVALKNHEVAFAGSTAVLPIPATATTAADPVLRCVAYQGTKDVCEVLGVCEASLRGLSTLPKEGEEREYLLVRDAGSPQAHVCGQLRLKLFPTTAERNLRSSASAKKEGAQRSNKADHEEKTTLATRVLSYLWHNARAELHRLDSVVQDAVAIGFNSAVARYASALQAENGVRPTVYATPRNSVHVVLRSVSFEACVGATEAGGRATANAALPAKTATRSFASVCVGWSCGCYAGRSRPQRVSSSDTTLHFNEALPAFVDADPWREELRVVLYSVYEGRDDAACELCRAHVLLRSFRVSAKSVGETVRLPLVWHAGERGAFEHGFVTLVVAVAELSSAVSSAGTGFASFGFRRSEWRGFHADWPPREAVAQMLRCYATDQLHRLLPLLADAEGEEDVLLKRLHATFGPCREPVQLRICLVSFRSYSAACRKCYLKLYHGDASILRTPTIVCGIAAPRRRSSTCFPYGGGSGAADDTAESDEAVPLLDEDKYLFYFSTTAPHRDTLLLKMGVEHVLRKNDVVAYAEMSVGAFVSLESRLEESMQRPPHSGSRSPPSLGHARSVSTFSRPPLWVPLRNDDNETVAEVAMRVQWVHAVPLAPVRRITTQKKSTVTAVRRTSSDGSSAGSSGEVVPLFDASTARDLFSLLHAYRPEELYRWSWHLSRWADATKAHQRLRRELLPPQVVATVYVDIVGLLLRAPTSLSRLGVCASSAEDALAVSALCLGCASPSAARCSVLPSGRAHAAAQLAVELLAALDGRESTATTPHTLRLDLQLPTLEDTAQDLCLVFSTTASAPSPFERPRAFSAPKRGRRNRSAEHFRQLRACSAAAPLRRSTFDNMPLFQARNSLLPVKKGEVGRVYLSLRALLTTPELYDEGEVVAVPLVAHDGAPGRPTFVVVGDVFVRVRTPTHEAAPDWLRYSSDQLQRIRTTDAFSKKAVHARLHQRQRRLELAGDASATDLAEVHATFFRVCGTPANEAQCKNPRVSQGRACNPADVAKSPAPPARHNQQLRSTSTQMPTARPPLVPRATPSPLSPPRKASAAPQLGNMDGVFTVHDVFPRVSNGSSGSEETAELEDFTTPQRQRKGERSVHEWTSEKGGITVERSSGTNRSTPSLKTASSQESHLATKRPLIF